MFVLNVFLFLVFWACAQVGDFTRYQDMKDTGLYPCHGYVVMPWTDPAADPGPPPPCFYDPGAY